MPDLREDSSQCSLQLITEDAVRGGSDLRLVGQLLNLLISLCLDQLVLCSP